MSTTTIYSIGDSEFMAMVLNAIAMIFGGEHSVLEAGDLVTMFKIFFSIGVLSVVFSGILRGGGGIEFQKVFIGFVLFSIAFIPKIDVVISDVPTGNVRTVANVPWGVAMSGAAISGVGAKMTAYMDLAFSAVTPGSQTGAFLEPLQILNAVRRSANQPILWQAMAKDSLASSSSVGGFVDVYTSWYNYIYNCSLFKIDQHIITPDELQTLPWRESLRLDSAIVFTLIYDKPDQPAGRTLSCTDAWNPLIAITSADGANVKTALNSILGITETSSDNAITKLNSATNVTLAGAITAQEYIITSVLEPVLHLASKGRLSTQLDTNAATMINTALAQRDTQWAAEQSFFMVYMRPMIAFFESIVYALSPIIACVFLLGQVGISVALKYFLLNLWVQLFLPLLSIINLYISVKATHALAITSSALGNRWDSFYALNSASDQLQHWIAMGGGIAAATPFIALALVMGAPAATMTALSSRLQGSDQINEKVLTPDPISTDPVIKSNSYVSGDRFSGIAGAGAPSQQISFGQTFSSVRSSIDQEAIKYSSSLGNSIQSAISNQGSQEARSSIAETLGSAAQTSRIVDSAWGREQSQGLKEILGNSEGAKSAINSLIGLNATGALSTPKGAVASVSAALSGSSDWLSSSDRAQTIQKVTDFLSGIKTSDSDRAGMSRQLASSLDDSKSTGASVLWSDQNTATALKNLSNNADQAKSFAAQDSSANSLGILSTLNDNHLLNALGANTPNGSQFISQMHSITNPAFQAEARRHINYASAHNLFPGDPGRTEAYGYLRAMTSPQSFDYKPQDGSDRSSGNLRDQQSAITALTTALSASGLGSSSSNLTPVGAITNSGVSQNDLAISPFSGSNFQTPSQPIHKPNIQSVPNPNSDLSLLSAGNDEKVERQYSSNTDSVSQASRSGSQEFNKTAFNDAARQLILDHNNGRDMDAPLGAKLQKSIGDTATLGKHLGETSVKPLYEGIQATATEAKTELDKLSAMSADELKAYKSPDSLANSPLDKVVSLAKQSGSSLDGFVASLAHGKPSGLTYAEYSDAFNGIITTSMATGDTRYSAVMGEMNDAYIREKFNEGKSMGLSDSLSAVYQDSFIGGWSGALSKLTPSDGADALSIYGAIIEKSTHPFTPDPTGSSTYMEHLNEYKMSFVPAGTDQNGVYRSGDGTETQIFSYVTTDSGQHQIQLSDATLENYSNTVVSRINDLSTSGPTSTATIADIIESEKLREASTPPVQYK